MTAGCIITHETTTKRTLQNFQLSEVMTYCNYAALVGGLCGPSTYNSSITECVTLANCNKDVFSHLSLHKASDDVDVSSESKLILARAGMLRVLCF